MVFLNALDTIDLVTSDGGAIGIHPGPIGVSAIITPNSVPELSIGRLLLVGSLALAGIVARRR